MSKVKPLNKEQLVYYLLQNISLGTYDRRFLTNLQTSHTKISKPVTSNQSELLDKIVLKYFKQLKHKEIDATEMTKLPWGVEPIDSIPEYTDAFCTIKEDDVVVRTPYKKNFITEFKKTDVHLDWNNDNKTWTTKLNEYSLRHIINCLDKHFGAVRYCNKTIEIINRFAEFESIKYWKPTLRNVNGNFMIVATNQALDEAIKHIELSDSPASLARLVMHGVTIEDEYKTSLGVFATEHRLVRSYEEIPEVVSNLKEIGCDFVYISDHLNNKQIETVKKCCELNNIEYAITNKSGQSDSEKNHEYPVNINLGLWGSATDYVAKVINLANSRPILIKK